MQDWAKEDRPREKLMNIGSAAMSNVELLAILIRTGTQYMSAIDLAQSILKEHDYNLNELAKRSVKALLKFKGIGNAKAVTIVSALELGSRRTLKTDKTKKITSSQHAYKIALPNLVGKIIEEFWTILLNRSNHVIKVHQISKGGLSKTIVDPKTVFKYAFEYNASSIILVHNHPSGDLTPSQEDINLTKRIEDGAAILGINILDHLIVTDNNYLSFADEGMLKM